MYLVLEDQVSKKDIVYFVHHSETLGEEQQKYIICQKVNHDDPLLYLKVIENEDGIIYQEIEDDQEFFEVEQLFKPFLDSLEQ